MYAGKVVGNVVSTIKHEDIKNIPLLLVQLYENGKDGEIVVAADSTYMAGRGDFVYLIGKKEAARIFKKEYTPVDQAIVGFIDKYREAL